MKQAKKLTIPVLVAIIAILGFMHFTGTGKKKSKKDSTIGKMVDSGKLVMVNPAQQSVNEYYYRALNTDTGLAYLISAHFSKYDSATKEMKDSVMIGIANKYYITEFKSLNDPRPLVKNEDE